MSNLLMIRLAALAVLAVPSLAAAQQNVNFNANLTNSCSVTVNTTGVMTVNAATGTTMGSEESGGIAAEISVVYVGSAPTVTFGAPTLATAPGGWTDASTKQIAYTGVSRTQAYTSAQTSFTQSLLSDVYTVQGKVTSSAGFAAGAYQLRTVVTCS